MTKHTAEFQIQAVTMSMLLYKPFFGFIVSKMRFVECTDSKYDFIPTAATDGKNIFFNRKFFESLTNKECIFVVAHEIMHCVLESFVRKGDRDHQYWNMATDFAINQILQAERVGAMPKQALYDKKYAKMTAEQIYDDLLKKKAKYEDTLDVHMDADGQPDTGASGEEKDGDGKSIKVSKKELEENAEEFKKLIVESYQRSKIAGVEIGGIELMIQDLINPKINWKQLLRSTIQSVFRSDMSWTRPNRRNPCRSMILPSMNVENTIDIVVSVDTSGSISDQQRLEFLSEINGILAYYKNFKLHLSCFDTAVHAVQEYDQYNIGELMNYQPAGGGGTDIGCVYAYLEENDIKPSQLIMFTDAYNGSDWGPENYCPVLYIIHSNPNPQVPWGDWVLYEDLTQ